MPKPGDVVTVDFPGALGMKRRPAIVVSSAIYHQQRPDLILGLLTTNLQAATSTTDYVLQDWTQAGLRQPSAFRAYLAMSRPTNVRPVGQLSDRDWQGVRVAVLAAVG